MRLGDGEQDAQSPVAAGQEHAQSAACVVATSSRPAARYTLHAGSGRRSMRPVTLSMRLWRMASTVCSGSVKAADVIIASPSGAVIVRDLRYGKERVIDRDDRSVALRSRPLLAISETQNSVGQPLHRVRSARSSSA